MLNRTIFFNKIRSLFGGRLTLSQTHGLTTLIDVWETSFKIKTSIPQFAYELGTTHHETNATMQPIKEFGGPSYYKRMYDIQGSRPEKARELGNIYPGDGVKFPGMGYVQNTGRGNARKATKRLRELGIIDTTIDLEKNPELQMEPKIAAAIMFVGMEEGWFTGKTLDKIIDNEVDGDEHGDFVKARAIINGRDKAEAIANYADSYLEALVVASDPSTITDSDKIVLNNKDISWSSLEDYSAPKSKKKEGVYPEDLLAPYQVKAIQVRLRNLGYMVKVDGKWKNSSDPKKAPKEMKGAIIKLQATAGITEDGHYGPETEAALADDNNRYQASEAREGTEVKDLRKSGSRTIAGTDSIKSTNAVTGAGLGLMTAGSAVYQFAPDAISWISPIREFFTDVPLWAWGLIGLVIVFILAKNATKIEDARLDDERTGKNLGNPTPAESNLTAVSSNSEVLKSIFRKPKPPGQPEVDSQVTK